MFDYLEDVCMLLQNSVSFKDNLASINIIIDFFNFIWVFMLTTAVL
jgi:hypothetical protein